MNSPSTPPSPGDAALDAALRSLRDMDAPVAAVRDAHIAEALQHISTPVHASAPVDNVVSLASRRRRRAVAVLDLPAERDRSCHLAPRLVLNCDG